MVRRSARVAAARHGSSGAVSPSPAAPVELTEEDRREGPSSVQTHGPPNRRKRRISVTHKDVAQDDGERGGGRTRRIKRESSAPASEMAAHLYIADQAPGGDDHVVRISAAQVLRYTYQEHALLERQQELPMRAYLLHATNHTTPVYSLFARIEGFSGAEDFADMCADGHDLSLQRCMRGTLHYVRREALPVVHRLYGLDVREPERTGKWVKRWGGNVNPSDLQAWEGQILKVLEENGPMNAGGIARALGAEKSAKFKFGNDYDGSMVAVAAQWLWYTGRLEYGVWGEADRSWLLQNKQRSYRLVAHPIAKVELETCSEGDAIVRLAAWYFGMYGPASLNDFVWWSGLSVKAIREVFPQVIADADLVRVEVQDDARYPTMYIPRGQAAGLRSTRPLPCTEMARFLPYEDAIVKAYKETRFRFFGPAERSSETERLAMTRGGELRPTVWVDGRPVGLWSITTDKSKTKAMLEVKLFSESVSGLPRAEIRKKTAEELERLRAFVEIESVDGI